MLKCTYNGYLCGPTVNGKLHLGNFKTFYKSIKHHRRQFSGRNSRLIVNITDIGDAVYENAKIADVSDDRKTFVLQSYINAQIRKFIFCLTQLNLKPWTLCVLRTSSYIKQIGATIKKIFASWASSDRKLNVDETGIYPPKESNLAYLWRIRPDCNFYYIPRARDIVPEFLASSTNEFKGIPGWHIECATLILQRIKENFLIHYGGADLKMIHHSNESALLKQLRPELKISWVRTPVLITQTPAGDQKMSKSLKNIVPLQDHKPAVYDQFIKFFDSCSFTTNTYVNVDDFLSQLNSDKRPLNFKKRKYKVVKRLFLNRQKQKKILDYKNADLIRERLKEYEIRDLKKGSLIYVKSHKTTF